jgi:putative ABC transport system permease protein
VRFADLLDQLALDLRHSARVLRNARAFAAVAILSLALGIGANTAIFSILNGVMLKMLPVADPARLVEITDAGELAGAVAYTNPIWEQIRDHQQTFDGVFASGAGGVDLGTGADRQRVDGLFVSGRFFEVLGVRPWAGRLLSPADDLRGGGAGGPVAVLSYACWRDRYGASPGVIGSTIRLGGQPFTVVGVAPPGFFGIEVGRTFDIAIPIGTEPVIVGREVSQLDERSSWWLSIFGRLKEGQTREQAVAGLRALQPAVRAATIPTRWPASEQLKYLNAPFELLPAATGISRLRGQYRQALFVLMGTVGLVLLLACANLANLLLARATARQKEFAVRLALGGSRARLIRQLLIESLLLATAGAGLGVACAQWASGLLIHRLSSSVSRVFVDASIDGRVLAFTIGVTMVTAVLFGVAPAFRSTDLSANALLKSGARGIAAGWRRFTLEKLLVAVQIALSLTLVFGAALFVRSFTGLATRDPGFDPHQVLMADANLIRTDVPPPQRAVVIERIVESLRAMPGVRAAAYATNAPVKGGYSNTAVDVPGYTPTSTRDNMAYVHRIGTHYFDTLGTRLLAGRDFDTHDTPDSPLAIIANETFARKFFHGEQALGRTITQQRFDQRPLTVVGLVQDAVYRNLRDPVPPTIYFALSQQRALGTRITFLLRGSGDAGALARSVAQAGATVHNAITFDFRTLETAISDSLIQERVIAMLSGFFGTLALLVAGVGLYGMMSLAVTRRRNEIGVRMALGAEPGRVIRMVLREVATITLLGLIAGAAIALTASQLVAKLLFGLTPTDPATCAMATALLASVALLAGYLPARRASRVDPMIALREE